MYGGVRLGQVMSSGVRLGTVKREVIIRKIYCGLVGYCAVRSGCVGYCAVRFGKALSLKIKT